MKLAKCNFVVTQVAQILPSVAYPKMDTSHFSPAVIVAKSRTWFYFLQ